MSRHQARDGEGFSKFQEFIDNWSRRDFVKRMGLGAAYTAFLAGGAEFLEACANAGSGGETSQNVKKGGHVVEGNITDIKTLNPVLTSDTASNEVLGMIYDGLLSSKANGDLVPLLAKEMPKTSSDGLTYTITLRDNAKWSDGSPVTADDVKMTYDFMFDAAFKAVNSPRRGDLETYIQSITVKDPKTIVFQLKKVFAPFAPIHLQYGILPKSQWGTLSAQQVNTSPMNTKPTVTGGMFNFVNYTPGQQVQLAANANYWNGKPNVDSYIWKVVPDAVTGAAQLKTGELDIFGAVDPSSVADLQSAPDVKVVTFAVPTFLFYAYNQNPSAKVAKMFSDKAVRQALLYALNRQSMVDAIYFKQAVVANTPVPPVSWAYNKDAKPKYPFDAAKAESMLDAAGWKKGADGIRADSSGTKLSFTIITNAGNKARESAVTAMQDMWKKIGVDCSPKLVTFPTLVSQITNDRSYDTFLVGFNWTQDPDQSSLWASRNTAPGGFNGFNYKSQTMDKILDDAASTLDQNKRKQLYFQMQDLYNDELPAPILLFQKGIWAFSKRVQGYDDKDYGVGTYTQYQYRQWARMLWVQDGK